MVGGLSRIIRLLHEGGEEVKGVRFQINRSPGTDPIKLCFSNIGLTESLLFIFVLFLNTMPNIVQNLTIKA